VLLCIVFVQLPLEVSFSALSSGLGHTAFVGVIVNCLFLVGACSALKKFLHFRLGCHSLPGPVAAVRFAGAAHVARAHRVCLAFNSGAVGDEMHLTFECTNLKGSSLLLAVSVRKAVQRQH